MFTDTTSAFRTIGLDITEDAILAVQIESRKGQPALEKFFSIPITLNASNHVKPLYTEQSEKQFLSFINKNLVVTALPASDVMARKITVQLTKIKDIDKILEFQTEPLLPFPVEEAMIDRTITDRRLEQTDLMVCAARKTSLFNHIERWRQAGVEPETISCAQISLCAFAKLFSPIEGPHYLIHFGSEETICLLVNDGIHLNSQTIRCGIKDLKTAFSKDCNLTDQRLDEAFKAFDVDTVNPTSQACLKKKLDDLCVEIKKSIYSLAKQYTAQEVNDILITGNRLAFSKFSKQICLQLEKTPHTPQSTPHFSLEPSQLQQFAIPIGCALQALPKAESKINFRKKEFVFPHPWKRLKKPLAAYLILCLLLCCTFFLFGDVYLANKEDALRRQYLKVLELMNKPFDVVELEIKKRNPNIKTYENGSANLLREMSQNEIAYRSQLVTNEIKDSPDSFPLHPNTPKVSDFLAWLSNHPHINSANENGLSHPFSLESFNYKMIKRPHAHKMKERYQVKVELEFSTSTPRFAREFHDILLAPNEMVDPKEDVKWSAERGRYRASFFLKDRTIYPNGKKK